MNCRITECKNGYVITIDTDDWSNADMYVFPTWNDASAFIRDYKVEEEVAEEPAS